MNGETEIRMEWDGMERVADVVHICAEDEYLPSDGHGFSSYATLNCKTRATPLSPLTPQQSVLLFTGQGRTVQSPSPPLILPCTARSVQYSTVVHPVSLLLGDVNSGLDLFLFYLSYFLSYHILAYRRISSLIRYFLLLIFP